MASQPPKPTDPMQTPVDDPIPSPIDPPPNIPSDPVEPDGPAPEAHHYLATTFAGKRNISLAA